MDPRNSNGLARNNSREVRRLQREDSNYDARLSRGSRDDSRPSSMDMGSLSTDRGRTDLALVLSTPAKTEVRSQPGPDDGGAATKREARVSDATHTWLAGWR